jgi:hypothetical protein
MSFPGPTGNQGEVCLLMNDLLFLIDAIWAGIGNRRFRLFVR